MKEKQQKVATLKFYFSNKSQIDVRKMSNKSCSNMEDFHFSIHPTKSTTTKKVEEERMVIEHYKHTSNNFMSSWLN